jgi:hypothetical protein
VEGEVNAVKAVFRAFYVGSGKIGMSSESGKGRGNRIKR